MTENRIILLVDDDPDDRELLEHALNKVGGTHRIIEATNGVDCIARLHQLVADNQLPCLIVLDVNMPRMNGRQTIIALKDDPIFRKIPVVIFSTSSAAEDKRFFSAMGADYMTKPIQFHALLQTAKTMASYCDNR